MEPLTSDDPAEIGGYRLRARLGAGGMGRVYLASTPGGRRVALKVVRPELGDDADFRARFRQEIEAAQRVRGVYTAELLAGDPAATPPWLVTAYVPGPSLQQAVAEHGPMPPETVILLMAGVAEALQAIHSAGVIHRDLKPSNVLLAPDGPRVIDFGIARAAEATSLTQSGMAVGSPQFMAPEQVRGHHVTPAVDVFALGAVAAFALLARPPFGEGQVAALMYRVLNEPPALDGSSGPLRALIERCLAKNPADRPGPGEIIDGCRSLAAGNLGDFADSWLPPAVAAAAAAGSPGLARPMGPVSPPPRQVSGAPSGTRPAPSRGSGPTPVSAGSGRSTPRVGVPPPTGGHPQRPQQAGPAGLPWRPPLPSSVSTASRLMCLGAGLSVLGAIVGLAGVPTLKVIAAQNADRPGTVGAAVAILLIHGLVGTALWLWLARETGNGLRRARAWATVIFALATVSGIADGAAPSTGLTQAFSGIEWVVGLCAVILLWNRSSRHYYDALRPPPSYPPAGPSPSLRPRQVPPGSAGSSGPSNGQRSWGQPGTRRDWPTPDQPGQRR
ncbi:MAG: protein kinase domain-containing protein [Streptosporangiaceae bacterium]